MKLLIIALAIAYPLLAHAAVTSRSSALTIAALSVLAALVFLPRLAARNLIAWLLAPVAVVGLLWLANEEAAWLPLYALPVLLNLFAAWVFGHTLAPGHVPLIERFARSMHAPDGISPEIARYTRRVTLAWAVFLAALALLSLTLALLATPDGILLMAGVTPPITVRVEIWSLFANLLNYGLVGIFFLAEYVYRRRRFPEQPYRNLLDFLRRMSRIGPQVLGVHAPGGRRQG